MTTIIVNNIPIDKRCKTCDGWGIVGGAKQTVSGDYWYCSQRCPDCYGTGRRAPEVIKEWATIKEKEKDKEKEEVKVSGINLPTSIYPQTEPKHEGYYLVLDDVTEKWRIAEWCNRFARKDSTGGWQPCNDVRMFIPFRLLGPKG